MTVVLNVGVLACACLVLLPQATTGAILSAIDRHKVTVLPGVPVIFSMLCNSRLLARHGLSSLRYGLSGGAPLPPATQRRFEELTGCRLVEGYGLTEAGPVVTCNPLSAAPPPGSVGLPLPGTVVEIFSPDEPPRRLPPRVPGEVCVRGPQVMLGYLADRKASRAVLRDGHLRTGDIGFLDEAGFLYLTGRIKRLILVGGFNVYPRQVEAAIAAHPAVAMAKVWGVPDARVGERVQALVHLRAGAKLTVEELRAHLKYRLASFAIPREVTIVPGEDVRPAGDSAQGSAPEFVLEEDERAA
jgi:long-chain acyl-CoA synthetase